MATSTNVQGFIASVIFWALHCRTNTYLSRNLGYESKDPGACKVYGAGWIINGGSR
jgi:hypothetical protein